MQQKRETFVNFASGINSSSVGRLMDTIQKKLIEGVERFVILISSPGGEVPSGMAAYNFLRGIPAEVVRDLEQFN